jgi:hypothetical protein
MIMPAAPFTTAEGDEPGHIFVSPRLFSAARFALPNGPTLQRARNLKVPLTNCCSKYRIKKILEFANADDFDL